MARQPLLHQLVVHPAVLDPNSVAVLDGSLRVGAAELAGKARRLAGFLHGLGVGRGSRVGVCLPRCADLPLALLGVLEAGAALVPLPPGASVQWLEQVAEDAGIEMILTRDTIRTPVGGVRMVSLDSEWPLISAGHSPDSVAVTGDDLALVSYGSDGLGLTIDHASAVDYLQWMINQFGLDPADRVLGGSSPWEVFLALASGATLVTADDSALASTAFAQRVTVLALDSAMASTLTAQPEWPDCAWVRLAVSTGSTMDSELCRLLAGPGKAEVWQVHGLVGSGLGIAAHHFDQDSGVVLLGRPVGQVRVLDEFGDPLPPGLPGELYVSGLGRGHGYLGRPAVTAERIGPDPFGAPGSRMHRTGELVRWRNDGTLELRSHDRPQAVVPDSGRPPHLAPQTPAELAVARVWSELLEVADVGLDDNFFQLGGYSLLLTQLAERLRAATGAQVMMAELYTAATVREQAALLSTEVDRTPPVQPVSRDHPLPLSFGQRRLWFLDRMHPASTEWISPLLLRLDPEVTADTVRQAMTLLAARHESLRTRYVDHDGEPMQLIGPPLPVQLRVVECGPDQVGSIFREQCDTGFDLAAGQVWRATLARQPAGSQALLITIHHIACDGWSASVLDREFRQLCTDLQHGRVARLPALAVQYADFACWQHQWRGRDSLGPEVEFWRQALDGLAALDLPTDHPRPPERDPRGGLFPFTVPALLAAELTALGQRHEATPFMTLLAAFATLLARHSGQWDIAVGAPVAGRVRPEVEPVVGFFLNSLVLRCQLDGDLAFTDALERVRTTCLAAFAHQDVSFEHLVEELRPERDLSRTPLYQVALNFSDDQVGGGLPSRADGEVFLQARQVAKTDLTLYVRPEPDGSWTGVLEYAAALFRPATIERLAGHFVRLLESVVSSPATALSTVDFLSADERHQLLTEWNETQVHWPAATVLDRFEAQAAACPDAVAVIADGHQLTYAELNARANRLAYQLIDHGAGPDTLVGVCLDRGPDLVSTLLAVWKSGAAYVPLDPTLPAERLHYLLTDTQAPLLITQPHLANHLTPLFTGKLITLTPENAPTPNPPAPKDALGASNAPKASFGATPPGSVDEIGGVANPARAVSADNLAYVIHTSGSTGQPKGVMVTHSGLANHLRWAAEELTAAPGGAPLFSSIAFDLPATNLYVPLMTGQPVHLLPSTVDLKDLGRELVEAGPFSFVKLTPGHLDLLTHQLSTAEISALANVVMVAGEALPARTANHWLDALGPGRLINEYGPTEASIGSTAHPVLTEQHTTVPLGRPLPNTTGYVLDQAGHPAPVGVAGELHLGGAGLARGYLGQPALTAQKFRPNPYGPPGSRLYRTGDLTRRRADGALEFLGRIDTQVKVRGYRIEPGEIQAQLRRHPDVLDAVVVAREDPATGKSLVAYLVPASIDIAAVRDHLTATLPEYLIPAALVPIDRIPLTANGKLDHRALPAPDRRTGDHQPPASPVEQRIAAIWSELLGQQQLGGHDNFFELGGHSILAIRMVSRLQDEFDIDLSVRTAFEHPTISQLAGAVEDHIRAEIGQLSEAELREQQP